MPEIKIEHEWLHYKEKCVPEQAHEIQIEETKQAFFAGATTALNLINGICENLSEDQAMEVLQKIELELTQYAKDRYPESRSSH